MYQRQLTKEIITKLGCNPVVAILGPRQVGKTTLAFEIAKEYPSIYLDLERMEDLQKLQDPLPYLESHANKLVILDEIQRYPDLFMSLRGIVDAGRRAGKANGRFLVLGSASNALLKQSAESLAGRISYLELSGLTPFEVESTNSQQLQKLWTRGGFPDSYRATSDSESNQWRRDFIKTYLEHDIPQLAARIPATSLMRLWTMLAHTQGELLNASKLASSLGVQSVTINRYVDLMIDLLLVRKLAPFYSNVKKRLVKAPRTYIRDSGIVHTLLQIPDYEQLLSHPILGKSWEGFVIETILNSLPPQANAFFYRTSAGAEIDLLLEFNLHHYWAIEIKFSRTPKPSKGFHLSCEDLNVKRKFVIYSGDDLFSLGHETTAISLPLFLSEIRGTLKTVPPAG